MKKKFFLFLFLFLSTLSSAQSSLDSLRLVLLPQGEINSAFNCLKYKNNHLITTGWTDLTAKIYDIKTGKIIQVLKDHNEIVWDAIFSPVNNFILTQTENTAQIFDLYSGKKMYTLNSPGVNVINSFFSNNGRYIITINSDKNIRVFDVQSGIQIIQYEGYFASISDDDRQIAIVKKNELIIFNFLTESKVNEIKIDESDSTIRKLYFSEINNIIITQNQYDSKINFIKYSDGAQLHSINGIISDFNHEKILLTSEPNYDKNNENSLLIYDIKKSEILKIIKEDSVEITKAHFANTGEMVVYVSFNLESLYYKVNCYDLVKNENKTVYDHKNHAILDVVFYSNEKNLIIQTDNEFIFSNIESNDAFRKIDLTKKAIEINSIKNSNLGKLIIAIGKAIYVQNKDLNSSFIINTNHTEDINSVQLSSNEKLLLTASRDKSARIYDIDSGFEKQIFIGHNDILYSAVFSPDNSLILTASGDSTARIYEVSSGKLIKKFNIHSDCVNSAVFSPDGSLVLTASDDNTAVIYKTKTGVVKQILKGHSWKGILSAEFSFDGNFVITRGTDGTAILYNVESGKKINRMYHHDWLSSAILSRNNKLVLTSSMKNEIILIHKINNDKTEAIIELNGHTVKNQFFGGVNSARFNIDNKKVLTAGSDGNSIVFDTETGNVLSKLTSKYDLHDALFYQDEKFVITNSNGNTLSFWDLSTSSIIYEKVFYPNNNYLVKLPNSPYYMCSKDASKMLHYVTPNLKVIGFEQLDPVYNRPDIVLDSIGKYFGNKDKGMIDEYRKSWEKRIDRLGLDKEKLGTGEIAVPNAEIVNADTKTDKASMIEYTNSSGKTIIHVKATDSKYKLKRYNVYVNEVPVYGSLGRSITHLNTSSWEGLDTITLSQGENKIQVSVMNELGLENFKYPTYVNYMPEKEIVAKTHYIGIGVNAFKDSSHNLYYCVKDVRDLAKAFATENKHIDTLLFTDQRVTKENILALKEYLNNTSVNDKVIISCSSHGLLDDSLNFYLAMHDVDFDKPQARGLKYEELENLLDGIPARQKLLLLDACNSGENDKTELLKKDLAQVENQKETPELAEYKNKTKGVIIKLEEENKSNFKKMNELFVNVRNNTGSVIISAAGGQESALEAIKVDGKIIENGAFTYSILECLKLKEGKELKVNTLKQYAEKRVEEITNGKQKPTSRQETMEVDWGVR